MDYELSIKLNAINNATTQINSVKNSVDNLNKSVASSANGGFGKFAKTLESTGSRINVMGQRLTWMVSVPLLMFANKSIETAVSIESSWVRFNKVFSGTEEEMNRLRKAGTELSTKFGVNVEDVADVMGEFSKAGIDSEESLKSLTDQALQTSILFDTDLTSAFEGVRAVMFGFGLDAEQTRAALAAINMVADKTTTSEQDILDVMERAGGVFKQHNIGITEAASLTSLLAQANIKGAIAGNSLKSIITGMDIVTNAAGDAMANFGINMRGTEFRTASFSDKLKILNKKQQEVYASGNKSKIADWNEALGRVAGKLQISRFNILIDKIGQVDGVMQQAGDETANLKYWNEQLATVLESSPKKLDIMNQMYRNQQAIIGNELLPIKMKLLEILIKLLEKFNSLPKETQDLIIKFGLIAAAAGPVSMALGLIVTVLGYIFSTVGIVITAVVAYFAMFYLSWKNTIDKFKEYLPKLIESFTGLKQKISDKFEEIKTSISEKIKAIHDKIIEIWGKIVNYIQNDLLKDLGFAIGVIVALFVLWPVLLGMALGKLIWWLWDNAFKPAIEYLGKNIPIWFEAIVNWFSTLPDRIFNACADLGDQLKNAFKNAVDYLSKNLPIWLNSIIDTFKNLPKKIFNALADLGDWIIKAFNKAIKEVSEGAGEGIKWILDKAGIELNVGGVVKKANGGLVYAANGFLSKGRDTIPAMLSPGEMVLNKSQQSTLFDVLSGKSQLQSAGGPQVTIQVGTMIASRGEQREFARKIEELLTENSNRK